MSTPTTTSASASDPSNLIGLLPDAESISSFILSEAKSLSQEWKLCDSPAAKIWACWATEWDDTGIMYVLDSEYDELSKVTSVNYPFLRLDFGLPHFKYCLHVIGYYGPDEVRPEVDGDFWNSDLMSAHYDSGLSDRFVALLGLGRVLPDVRKLNSAELSRCYAQCRKYTLHHRECVIGLGEKLGVEMYDHDITKTSPVRVALGLLWEWDKERCGELPPHVLKAATDAMTYGHLNVEDHHPQSTTCKDSMFSTVCAERLFTDRLAVHLVKDDIDTKGDTKGGWGINERFLPPDLLSSWESFKSSRSHVKNLYPANISQLKQYKVLCCCSHSDSA